MLRHSLIISFLCCCILTAGAQTIAEGQALYNDQRYTDAARVFSTILKRRPNDGLANFGYGQTQNKLGNKDEAIKALQTAVNRKITAAYPLLCELCFQQYYFDEAVSNLEAFLALPKISPDELNKFGKMLAKAKIGAQLLQRVEDITIVDSLQAPKHEFYKYYSLGKDIGAIIPSKQIRKNAPDGALAYRSQRGDRVVFSDSLKHKLGLYATFQMIDTWSDPAPLSDQVNGTGSSVNYPFVSSDGVTLYFAAQGENSLGGYDLFITRFNSKDNSYYAPQNMGFPFNSMANDYLMVVDEINNVGWFATDRNQPEGRVMIYKYLINPEKKLVQTNDSSYLRLAAQLKTYKKGKLAKPVNIASPEPDKTQEGMHNSLNFRVNDTLVYHTADQFVSEKARDLYQQADSLNRTLQLLQEQLDEQRALYGSAASAEERGKIEPQILALEQKMNGMRDKPQQLFNEARQTELETLKAKE